jgi:hypothetical protein
VIRQVIKDSIKNKSPEEAETIAKDIRKRAALWTPEEAKKCEKALKAYIEGYPPLNILPITQRNPYFQYFNGKLHRAEMTPHNHLAYTAFGESKRSGIGLSINFMRAMCKNLEHQKIDLTVFCEETQKRRPMSNREKFNAYRSHERSLLDAICKDMGISMKAKILEISAAENRAKPENEQREDKDIGDFKGSINSSASVEDDAPVIIPSNAIILEDEDEKAAVEKVLKEIRDKKFKQGEAKRKAQGDDSS